MLDQAGQLLHLLAGPLAQDTEVGLDRPLDELRAAVHIVQRLDVDLIEDEVTHLLDGLAFDARFQHNRDLRQRLADIELVGVAQRQRRRDDRARQCHAVFQRRVDLGLPRLGEIGQMHGTGRRVIGEQGLMQPIGVERGDGGHQPGNAQQYGVRGLVGRTLVLVRDAGVFLAGPEHRS